MELLMPALAAFLVAAGLFLVLSRALIRVILGLSIMSYGINLGILLAGAGFAQDAPPLLDLAGPHNDPLPQALILTAIVIGFGTTALLLVLSLRAYQATGTDDVSQLVQVGEQDEEIVVYVDPESGS
ncbi:MAG TPA: NADH-quinone oxidoreductase subunit K [Trueperaceae bacterium]|nr:NADH-quinone oxidoreductase subunit K [Trueperaceae bacterium]